ncbi:hypothetical protein Klosneuvirus_1_169 [Klosneuvirus KNV1]|uniref:Uncharacterized protein n=1 Tax=Klosneuvirus KNV1 TaxID=1977640 RepID=A0A1V0SHX0_9VIRU|nr:hypothetical protein Klosneuvirus_1_169 [Klosneuvirus KNV1]
MINLTKEDSIKMWNDIIKFLTMAIIIHLLLYIVDDYGELFSELTLKIFLYITISLVVYYLIIRKIAEKHFIEINEEKEIEKKVEKSIKKKRNHKKNK